MMKFKAGLGLAMVALALSAVGYAAEYNFYDQSGKSGCDSLITEAKQNECAAVQRAKNDACKNPVDCDPDKQQSRIDDYTKLKSRLDRGEINDSDKDKAKQTLSDLKTELDTRKQAARDGRGVAEACVAARTAVQKWFSDVGIPHTEQVRDAALRERKDLLEKLADAQRKQSDAKSKRDANPNDSSAQSDYERATQAMRDCEKALETFNSKYGKDIERHAERLIKQYQDEKVSHEKPLQEATNRVDKCKKIENMSY